MGISDTKSIDIILRETSHAKLTLLISDGETHADEAARAQKLLDKLRCYVSYIMSEQFAEEHPNVKPSEVLIGVLCVQPPTEFMKSLEVIRPHNRPDISIAVACAVYKPGDELPWFTKPVGT